MTIRSIPSKSVFALLITLFLVGAIAANGFLVLKLQDSLLLQRASYDFALQQSGAHPFHWAMDSEHDLLRVDRNSLEDLEFVNGQLHARSADADPYFWLNLRGRYIDANRFPTLRLRIHSERNGRLQLHHQVVDQSGLVLGASGIELNEGWQTLHIDLNKQRWKPYGQYDPELSALAWGGSRGVVTALRIDPITSAGVEIKIDAVELLESSGARGLAKKTVTELACHWLELARCLQNLHDNSKEIIVVYDDSIWRLPQSSLYLREQSISVNPDVIFVPRSSSLETVSTEAETILEDIDWPLRNTEWFIAGFSLFVLLAVLGLQSWARQGRELLLQGIDLFVAILALSLVWLLASNRINPATLVVAGAAIAIIGLQLQRRIQTHAGGAASLDQWRTELGINWSSWPQWRGNALVTLAFAVLMLALLKIGGEGLRNGSDDLLRGLFVYPLWALPQQIVLGPVLALMVFRCLDGHLQDPARHRCVAAVIAGFLFSLLHLPNFALSVATLLLGSFWAWSFLRYRSVIPLAICHGILGTCFREMAPSELRMNGDIGLLFYQWLW